MAELIAANLSHLGTPAGPMTRVHGKSSNRVWRLETDQGVFARYVDFSKGVIDLGDFVYFIAATAVFLFVTVKVLESRRWK